MTEPTKPSLERSVSRLRTVRIGRTEVDALTYAESLAEIARLVESPGVRQHAVVNASKVVAAQRDDTLVGALEACDLVNADGMSVVWASRLLGTPVPERVTGIDLMFALFGVAAERGWPVYLLGAREHVVATVVERLGEMHPGLTIAGARNGYWESHEEADIVQAVRESGARLLFVAMPSPKKELWVARHRDDLGVDLVMGVGGSFDVLAGVTRRAPKWMQNGGLEWFYRFVQEPRRMWRRYLVGNAAFAAIVLRQRLAATRTR